MEIGQKFHQVQISFDFHSTSSDIFQFFRQSRNIRPTNLWKEKLGKSRNALNGAFKK